jgi:putative transposase
MPEYRRSWIKGGTFFFALVTYQRRKFLIFKKSRDILHKTWEDINQRYPFSANGICLLPDHLYWLLLHV